MGLRRPDSVPEGGRVPNNIPGDSVWYLNLLLLKLKLRGCATSFLGVSRYITRMGIRMRRVKHGNN